MTLQSEDMGKLKSLAEAATGPVKPGQEVTAHFKRADFRSAASPAVILSLIAEIEALRPAHREPEQPSGDGGEVELTEKVERAGLWASLPDNKYFAAMDVFDAFETGKRAATKAIVAALSTSKEPG